MKFEINMINVEDGDSIILQLVKADKKALILIDGGYQTHYPKLKRRLDELLPSYGNKIDLIICSHYDNDHIEGISLLIDDCFKVGHKIEIGKIWLHKIEGTLSEMILSMNEKLEDFSKKELPEKHRMQKLSGLDIDVVVDNLVIENYTFLRNMLKKMLDYGLEDKIHEAKRGDCLQGFEEFSVISPKADYYNSYLSELKKEKMMIDAKNSISDRFLSEENTIIFEQQVEDNLNPCEKLEISSVANSVTPTNMVSIVTTLQTNGLKLLFTADSGIESYQKQQILDHTLKDLDWLQLPHHGSKNNTSKIMLSHFNPKITFVSGKGIKNRPDAKIVNCIREKERFEDIHVTNSDKNTWYLSFNEEAITKRILNN